MGKTVDEILKQIGQMGRFQITRLAMFCVLMFPPTFHLLNMFFLAAEPPWQCVKNSTECQLNGSFVPGDDDYGYRCNINRSEWEYADYDGPKDSIVTEFDLVCDKAFHGWMAKAMVNVGKATATIPLGMISDQYGRLKTLYPSIVIIITVGFASSFATKFWQVLVSSFVIGSVIYGINFPLFILSGEFVGPRYRPLSQTVVLSSFSAALMFLGLMAYFVRTWRILMILCTAPWIFVLIFWKFTPESIRWYITHDKIDKAEKELRDIARINRKEYPEEMIKVPVTSTKNISCLALFSSWSLAFSVMIQAFAWFTYGMVYYGVSYGAGDLGGNMYLNFVLTNLIEIPANLLVIDNCKRYFYLIPAMNSGKINMSPSFLLRFGRRKTVIAYFILGGLACVVVSLIPAGTNRTDYTVGRVIGGILGKGFIVVSFNSVYIWSSELFPTVVRNSGLAFVGVISRIGAISAPFVVELKRIYPTLPFGLMGGLALVAALLCFFLPETKGMPTVEVYENNDAA